MAEAATGDSGLKTDLLSNGYALLGLHSACLGAATALLGKSDKFNLPLAMGSFMLGGVLAVLSIYYGVVNGATIRRQLGLEPEQTLAPVRDDPATLADDLMLPAARGQAPDPTTPAGRLLKDLVRLAPFAMGFVVLVVAASIKWRVWPGFVPAVLLAAAVLLPLPLTVKSSSLLVTVARGVIAFLSLLIFVVGIGLSFLPSAVANLTEGAKAVGAAPAPVVAAPPDTRVIVQTLPESIRPTPSKPPTPGGDVEAGVEADQVRAAAAALERRLAMLESNWTALHDRPVQVTMLDSRPAAPKPEVHLTVEPSTPAITVQAEQGPPGQPGDPGPPGPSGDVGPVWRCEPALSFKPFLRKCGPRPASSEGASAS